MNLNFDSPKVYEDVQKYIHRFKSVNARPGLTKEAFSILKSMVNANNEYLFCNLSCDEIHIRTVEWVGDESYDF